MLFIQLIAKAIGKVWSFITAIILIVVLAAIALFGLTIVMPANVLMALDIVKTWLTEVGIVGFG